MLLLAVPDVFDVSGVPEVFDVPDVSEGVQGGLCRGRFQEWFGNARCVRGESLSRSARLIWRVHGHFYQGHFRQDFRRYLKCPRAP